MNEPSFFNTLISIGSVLLGVLIGGIVTYFVSLKILEKQQNIQKRNIARAFLSESQRIEEWMKPSIEDDYIIRNPDDLLFNLYKHAFNDLFLDRPLITDDCLYFTSRTAMYSLDEDVFDLLEHFYSKLLNAEEFRKIFFENKSLAASPMGYHDKRRFSETLEAIKRAYSLIDEIKLKLERIVKAT